MTLRFVWTCDRCLAETSKDAEDQDALVTPDLWRAVRIADDGSWSHACPACAAALPLPGFEEDS